MFKLATRATNFSRFKGQISVGLFLNEFTKFHAVDAMVPMTMKHAMF